MCAFTMEKVMIMGKDRVHELRRFCHIVSGVLLAVCLSCVAGILFTVELPLGAALSALPVFALLLALQDRITTELAPYLEQGMGRWLKRLWAAVCVLLLGWLRCRDGGLTPEFVLLAILAAYALCPLLDVAHAMRELRRTGEV